MKVLFVFTGGTIGSTIKNGYISADTEKPYILIDAYSKKYGIDFEYDVFAPFTELSENNTGITLKKLISAIDLSKEYSGIVVMHGTDTLQYTSAALGYYFGLSKIPICIVSSNYPIEDKRANGLYNLFGAVSLIRCKAHRGVFTVYKNSGEEVIRIHRASRLLFHDAFSDELRSVCGLEYGYIDSEGAFYRSPDYSEKNDVIGAPMIGALGERADSILWIRAFVGMNYPTLSDGIKYVLIDAYHSGTVDTKSSTARAFFKEAERKNIKVFLSGASDLAPYESTSAFDELSIIPIKKISPIALYMKLWLYSQSGEIDENFLGSSRGGDIC